MFINKSKMDFEYLEKFAINRERAGALLLIIKKNKNEKIRLRI